MGLFDDLFDFNRDGKVSKDEEFMAFTMFSAISEELSADGKVRLADDVDDDLLDDEDDDEPVSHITITLKKDADDIESDLEELRDKLSELEGVEPDDILSARHDRWEEKCNTVREAVSEMESQIQERIDAIQEKLDDLESDSSRAHDRWEERCEKLQEQIDELEALL